MRYLLLLLAVWLSSCSHPGAYQMKADFYVSANGKDGWSGRLAQPSRNGADGPFATLAQARDSVRALRQKDPARKEAITVVVSGGNSFLNEPLVLTPEDSGTEQAPIVYAAAEGEKPIISGGRPITGWKKGDANTWTAQIPEVKAGQWYFRQLFVNGRRAVRARTPNQGFFTVEGPINNTSKAPPSWFKYRGTDIKPEWAAAGDVEVIALQAWAELRMQIREVKPDERRVTLAGTCQPSNRENDARYWLENAAEFLDSPGEWYLDAKTGVLSYWPLHGEDMTRAEVIAPRLNELLRLKGDPAAGKLVRNVHFRGLTFSHSDWSLGEKGYADIQAAFDIPAAIECVGAVGCSFEDCRIADVGTWAVQFAAGCKNNKVARCEITGTGAGGVKIGEPRQHPDPAQHASGNILSDCRIHDIGIVYPAAVGVWIGQSYDNRVSHNAIYDTGYSAVSVGWTWGYGPTLARGNIIEFNHLYNISRGMLSDLGAVYTLGTQPGTIIRNNLIHDVQSHGYGGWGLYTDEGSSQIVLENNIVYRTNRGGFHQHYGRENIVRNNVFALTPGEQIIRTRQEEHISFTFERNIIYFETGSPLNQNWDNDKFVIDNNLYWCTDGKPMRFAKWSFEEWQKRGHDAHSLIADPLFADPAKGDFALGPESPALKLGFEPIDAHAVGPEAAR